MAGKLIVLAFEGQHRAAGVLGQLQEMEKRGLLTLVDAVVVKRSVGSSSVEIEQTHSRTGKFALRGSAAGAVAGLLLLGPMGLVVIGAGAGLAGAGIGAAKDALNDAGINDDFIKTLSRELKPDSSAIFLQVDDVKNPEQVLAELSGLDAIVLNTDLEPEAEERLKETVRAHQIF